tara:strand:+ start:949 stop:1524 length:576 start_codon:yes stop_codon:yes gene_type:complete
VKSRKKKIISVQIIIFLVASLLLYKTYHRENKYVEEAQEVVVANDPDTNSFNDIQYSGFDLSGNRYVLDASNATFKTKTPERINMKGVVANFYLKDNTILTVISDEGLYNNLTLDMEFKQNVKSTYETNTLFSDKLIYFSDNGKLIISGNVRGESIEKGKFFADNVEYNLTNKTLDFSMFNDGQVNIKLKN